MKEKKLETDLAFSKQSSQKLEYFSLLTAQEQSQLTTAAVVSFLAQLAKTMTHKKCRKIFPKDKKFSKTKQTKATN